MMTLHDIFRQVHNIPEKVVREIEKYAVTRNFTKRERLVTQDLKCNHVYFIASGLCRGMHDKDGTEDTRWFATEGDVLTSITAWHTGRAALFSIEAVTDVKAFEIPYVDMKRLIANFRELQDWLVKVLMEQLYVLEQRYVIIGTGDARSRYEALLNGRPQEVLNGIPLKYLAQYLKMSQETLSRVRRACVKK